jgi:divalent metal cation (Fe/Co/Zn/Cd) transporter
VTELGSEEGQLPEQLQSEAQAGGHGTKAVVVALLANLGIAVAEFVGYLVTGASSMLAEALHSVADSGNQAMLLAGGRLARRQADPNHPFGHGRVRYFAAFLVAVVLFTLGSLFSLYEGYQKLRHPPAGRGGGFAPGAGGDPPHAGLHARERPAAPAAHHAPQS